MQRIFSNLPISNVTTAEIATIVNDLVNSLSWILPTINPDAGKYEPPSEYRRNGFIAFANGTDWDPLGTGAGLYRYDTSTSAWVKVG